MTLKIIKDINQEDLPTSKASDNKYKALICASTYNDKREVIKVLRHAVVNDGNRSYQNKHVENIKDMIGKDCILKELKNNN